MIAIISQPADGVDVAAAIAVETAAVVANPPIAVNKRQNGQKSVNPVSSMTWISCALCNLLCSQTTRCSGIYA